MSARPEPLVEADRRGVALDQLGHRLGEQGRPGLGFLVELVGGHRGSWVRVGQRPAACASHGVAPVAAPAGVQRAAS